MKADAVVKVFEYFLSGNRGAAISAMRIIESTERAAGNSTVARRLDRLLTRQPQLISLPNAPSSLAMLGGERSIDSLVLPDAVRGEVDALLCEWRGREKLAEYGIPLRRSILLHGPSGNGKTAIAHAIATAMQLHLAVARYEQVIDSYRGASSKEVAAVFEFASQSPCVLFFDEADSVASRRKAGGKDCTAEDNRTVNTLLMSMDRLGNDSLVMFATNMPRAIDGALKRRIDITLELPAPGDEERMKMIALMQAKWPMANGDWESRAMLAKSLAGIEQIALSAARTAVLKGTP